MDSTKLSSLTDLDELEVLKVKAIKRKNDEISSESKQFNILQRNHTNEYSSTNQLETNKIKIEPKFQDTGGKTNAIVGITLSPQEVLSYEQLELDCSLDTTLEPRSENLGQFGSQEDVCSQTTTQTIPRMDQGKIEIKQSMNNQVYEDEIQNKSNRSSESQIKVDICDHSNGIMKNTSPESQTKVDKTDEPNANVKDFYDQNQEGLYRSPEHSN